MSFKLVAYFEIYVPMTKIYIICVFIHLVVKEEIAHTVKFLIDQGADLNAKTSQGFTALTYASRDGFLETVKHLISSGAEVDSQTNFGYTSLMVSLGFKYIDTSL